MTEKELAKKLGIAESTLNEYKKRYPEFTESLKKGKEELVEELEDSLYRKALGYEYNEVKKTTFQEDLDIKSEKTEIIKKHMAPDVGAIVFSLKNLDRGNWKDRPLVEEMEKLKKEMAILEKEKIELENELIKTKIEVMRGYGQEIEDIEGVEELIYGNQEEKDN